MVGGVARDADALAWAAAVTAASGTYSGTTLSALSTLITGLKSAGLWTKMVFFNPVCGDQLAAARVQYKSASGTWAQAAVTALVNGDYTEATGIKGNGSSKYLDTQVTVSQMPGGGNNHMGFYGAGMETSGADKSLMGAYGASPFPGYVFDSYSPGNGGRGYFPNDGSTPAAAAATASGLLADAYVVGSQTATNLTKLYQAGSNIATSTNSTGATISGTNTIFVLGVNGSFGFQHSVAYCRGYHAGQGLSSGDDSTLKSLWDTFNTALSRNV
jgi:hypothetical protein